MNPLYVIAGGFVLAVATGMVVGCFCCLLNGMCAEAERAEHLRRVQQPSCRPRVLRSPECKERRP